MPQKSPVAKKGASYASAKKAILPPKRAQTNQQAVHGKKHQPSKGVKPVGSKVGFGAQSALHSGTKNVRAFQMAPSAKGESFKKLHMKNKASKTSKNQGYKKA